ncbi:MAG: hypothetical protein ACO3VB_09045 [Opitutales bacterium]
MQILVIFLFLPILALAQDLPPGQILHPEEALPEYDARSIMPD